jgi:biofilm PGA synthesis N-glycosyltransferase PgaC
MKIVALVPAYNEESTVAATITALLNQTVPVSIVVIPNGCTDATAEVARQHPVTVMELPKLEHKKSEAMNLAWLAHAQDADFVITVDADTLLDPNSVEEWMRAFAADPLLGGSSARFTMRGTNFLARLQRADFAVSIDISLRRGTTNVLAGAGSCFRNGLLHKLVKSDSRVGPWSYASVVEDLEVTYRIREMGFRTTVSPTVRAYTGSMASWKALRGQRMKWMTGTIEDLISYGWNKNTTGMWAQQAAGLLYPVLSALFITMMTYTEMHGGVRFSPWWLVVPILSWAKSIKHASRVPNRDRIDIALGAAVLVYEVFGIIRMVWHVTAWIAVLRERMTGKRKDRWALQYAAEGV